MNVLVYGPPGTGKTEVVRALAEHLGAPLFEIAVEDRHGEVLRGEARFGALQLAQGVLGGDGELHHAVDARDGGMVSGLPPDSHPTLSQVCTTLPGARRLTCVKRYR